MTRPAELMATASARDAGGVGIRIALYAVATAERAALKFVEMFWHFGSAEFHTAVASSGFELPRGYTPFEPTLAAYVQK